MSLIREIIDSNTPKMNPILAEGVAYHQMKNAVRYLDEAMQSAAKSFPEGLVYEGCSKCNPLEEYERSIARSQKTFDVATSHLRMIKFEFSYNGKRLKPVYVNILFSGPASLTMLNNSEYMISPTLNDIVFSVTMDSIFVRLLRDRMRFQRLTHKFEAILSDDTPARTELVSVVYCPIHKGRDQRPYMPAETIAVHYLFAKYGFTEAFRRYAGFVPVVGEDDINHDNYPADEWVICQTGSKIKPKAVRQQDWYRPVVKLAIPREHYNQFTKSMVAGFYYIVDHFHNRMRAQWVDNTRQWKIILGLMIFSGDKNEGELHEDIDDHIRSTDEYLDVFIKKQLRGIGIEAENLYDILALLIRRFTEWSSAESDRITTLYNKELNVNYFLFFRITKHIFSSVFALTQRVKSRRNLTAEDIESILNKELTMNRIFKVTSDNKEVSIPQSPNDSMTFRLTSIMIPQSANESSSRGAKTINLNDLAYRLHASLTEVGGYNSMSKNHPDGRHRLNLYALIDSNYQIVRREKFIPLIDEVQEMIHFR